MRYLLRILAKLLLAFILISLLAVVALRWLPVPYSAVMAERQIQAWHSGQALKLKQQWKPWVSLPDDLKLAVIAGEDQKFAEHSGFDWSAIRAAFKHNAQGGSLRGASTLSQQTAKNIFLWSGRSWLRKGLETWFTALIELLWPKQRILEVYLNIAEWGDGIFGAEAAAQHHFAIGASYLSRQQACLLAATLPNPRNWSAAHPTAYVRQRAAWIRQQSWQLGGRAYLDRIEQRPFNWRDLMPEF